MVEFKGRVISNDNRELLWAARTYYVRTDGSDSNDGLTNSAGGAFLTIQAAVNAYQKLDTNGYDVTIQVGNGTFSEDVLIESKIGAGNLYLTGDGATPSNVIISSTSYCVYVSRHVGGFVFVSGFKVTASAGDCLVFDLGASVQVGAMEYGSATGHHIKCTRHSDLYLTDDYTISGAAAVHIRSDNYSQIGVVGPITATISGTPAFSYSFAYAEYGGIMVINSSNTTWSGSATGVYYYVNTNAIIDTAGSGATWFPGDSSGSTGTQGQYI